MERARLLVTAFAWGCGTTPSEAGLLPDADGGANASSSSGSIEPKTSVADADDSAGAGQTQGTTTTGDTADASTGTIDTCGDGNVDPGEFCPTAASSYPAAMRPRALAIGDFDGDTHLDVAVGAEMTSDVLVLANLGDGTFADTVPRTTYLGATVAMTAANLRDDDHTDLVVGNGMSTINVLASNGNGFDLGSSLGTGTNPGFAIADFDGEPGDDLAVARPDGTLDFFHGDGNGYLIWRTYMVGWPGASAIVAGELDGDAGAELVAAADDGHLQVLRGFGENNAAIATTLTTDAGLIAMVLGDFDGDEALDLAGLGNDQGSVTLWHNTGDDDVFAELTEFAVAPGLFELDVGDLDADGLTDLVVLAKDVAAVLILRGHGDGSFAPAQQLPVAVGPVDVDLGDLDGDGTLDLAVACAAGTVDVVLSTP